MLDTPGQGESAMGPDMHGGQHYYGLIIGVVIALAIVMLRNRRPRKLRIELLWVRPVLFTAILLATLVAAPPPLTPLSLGLMAAGLALGCVLGWQRGRFQRIEVDPETHAITTRASPIGMVFILALMFARIGLRDVLAQNAATLHLPAAAAVDALIVLAAGMFVTQGLEMWLRARKLLAEAQARKAGILSSSGNPPIVQ